MPTEADGPAHDAARFALRQRQVCVAPSALGRWVDKARADRDGGKSGLTTDERHELTRLRREVKTLREEREILKKAAAWFARETGSIPPKDSSS